VPLPHHRETLTLSNARAMASRGPDFLVDVARERGPNFTLRLGPITLTFIAEPEALQQVLQKRTAAWGRGKIVDGIRPLLGNGLPLSDPPLWLTQRRTVQPSFHKGNGPKWVDVMRDMTAPWLDRLKPGEPVQTRTLMMHIARDVIVRAMFSQSLESDLSKVDDALGSIEEYVASIAITPVQLPRWLPTPTNRRFRSATAYLAERLQQVIDERRAMAEPPRDLLTMLIQAKDPEGGARMSDRQLRDEVINIFYAGHETTANLLTWTTLLLDRHPDVRERAMTEVQQVLQGRAPEAEDIPKLSWLNCIVREALRLHPPAWMFARQAFEADEVAGVKFEPGQFVLLSPYITHRLPQLWPEPDRFDPQRFATEQATDAAAWKYRYLPFGAGPHVCIGNHFALLEAVTVLAMLLQRGHLAVEPNARVTPKIGATLSVGSGLPARFVPRAA
jgi:cytochrome P450